MGEARTTPPRRRPSMDDVARVAGVSKGSVSKVIRNAYGLSPAMRARVEAAIAELGYRPSIAARAMRGSSFSIGMEIPNLDIDFFTQIMDGATSRLATSEYQLIIAPERGGANGTRVLESLADRSVDGIIAIAPQVEPEWLEELARDLPIVLIGRHDHSTNYDTLTDDDEAGATLLVDHLLDLGHTRIAHLTVGNQRDRPDAMPPHSLRRMAYETTLARRGLEPFVVETGNRRDEPYRTAKDLLLTDPSITAIFAGNDSLAIDTLRAIAELGMTADDVSVVGYDDIRIASHPLVSLTSVTQFGETMGEIAIDLLLERIRGGRTVAAHRQVRPELRARSSSRAVRAGGRAASRVIERSLADRA
ncbi:transcriptional regulator, LacI family [Microbacterium pygmaeum]|uniref:Transcriptional regulator, LacI family n=2 Tax=Microbacterium pygmaeum TaxID=370764 RepID=A0A1G7VY16_9MICO|nr:transcriptional regulator, LacI family [Microbacterium pygmaeum]